MSNVKNLDDYRAVEDIVKQRFKAKTVLIGAVLEDGSFATFIPFEMMDIELVYLIKTLEDRRAERLL